MSYPTYRATLSRYSATLPNRPIPSRTRDPYPVQDPTHPPRR